MSQSAAASTRDLANAVRALAMDAVQAANSGHPGMPMGMADIAVALWGRHLKHNPANPHWWDRDRFVLSNGHASMLLYSLLHLSGYALPIEQLKLRLGFEKDTTVIAWLLEQIEQSPDLSRTIADLLGCP